MAQFTSKQQAGLSMVELMVAMTLGLLLTSAVLQIFINAKRTYELQQELSRIQENGRFAMEFLTRSVRQGDYWGCLKSGSLSADNVFSTVAFPGGIEPFKGFYASNGVSSYDPPGDFPLPDLLTVRGGTEGGMPVIGTPGSSATASTLKVPGFEHQSGITIKDGDIVLVSDCERSSIFQVTDKNTAGANKSLGHHCSPTYSPGNTVVDPSTGGCGASIKFTYGTDATLFNFGSTKYWIREGYDSGGNTRGVPVLVRGSDLDTNLSTGGTELVEGIENMQLLLGYDTDNDGSVEYYAPPTASLADMDKVIAVQISLVARSLRNNLLTETTAIDFNGLISASYSLPSTDRYLRKVFTTNVTLRNRLD